MTSKCRWLSFNGPCCAYGLCFLQSHTRLYAYALKTSVHVVHACLSICSCLINPVFEWILVQTESQKARKYATPEGHRLLQKSLSSRGQGIHELGAERAVVYTLTRQAAVPKSIVGEGKSARLFGTASVEYLLRRPGLTLAISCAPQRLSHSLVFDIRVSCKWTYLDLANNDLRFGNAASCCTP